GQAGRRGIEPTRYSGSGWRQVVRSASHQGSKKVERLTKAPPVPPCVGLGPIADFSVGVRPDDSPRSRLGKGTLEALTAGRPRHKPADRPFARAAQFDVSQLAGWAIVAIVKWPTGPMPAEDGSGASTALRASIPPEPLEPLRR